MAAQLRRRDPAWAAIWAGFGLAFCGIGATMTYPHPWFSPETSAAIATVSFVGAALCFARAIWHGVVGVPTLEGVSWQQYVKARERLRKEIAEQGAKIAELQDANSELTRTSEAAARNAPRQLSERARQVIASQLKDHIRNWKAAYGPQAGVAIYYHPGSDCASYAQEFSDLLASLGLSVFCSVLRPEYGGTSRHSIGIFVIDGLMSPPENQPTFADSLHKAMGDAGISSQRLRQVSGGGCILIIGAKADA
jgi:hypothetical protein